MISRFNRFANCAGNLSIFLGGLFDMTGMDISRINIDIAKASLSVPTIQLEGNPILACQSRQKFDNERRPRAATSLNLTRARGESNRSRSAGMSTIYSCAGVG